MQTVTLENGEVHNFPDEATKEQIMQALKKYTQKTPKSPKAPRDTTNSFSQFLGDIGQGAGQGLLNIAPGLANLGVSGINAATGSHISKVPMFDYAPHTVGADIGNIASFFTPGVAAKTISAAPKLAGMIGGAIEGSPIASRIASFVKSNPLKSSVAGNAILGGAYSPDSPGTGLAFGAAAPLASAAIPKIANKFYQDLRPSKILRGNLSPDELRQNLADTAGTKTDLGNVIGSPTLKRLYENVLAPIPFSGALDTQQKTAGDVINKGHGILNDLLGENKGEDVHAILNKGLEDSFAEHQANKNNLYGKANNLAQKENLQLTLPGFAQAAKKFSAGIENTNILKYEPDLESLISKLGNYKTPVKLQGGKDVYPSLQEANLLKGRLNSLAEQYSTSPQPNDRHAAGVFRNLSAALKGDIQDSIRNTGSKKLASAYQDAEDNYAKNFSPFLDKEIYKFANGHADPDTLLTSFIKTGKANDRANLLEKLMDKLPEEHKNLMGYGYLSRALDQNGVINPMKVETLLSRNSLGPRQLKTLFPDPAIRQRLNSFINLTKQNRAGLTAMENPKTGQMNLDILPMLGSSPMKLLGKIGMAKPLVKKLTSEETRRNLINQMLQNEGQ